MARVSRDLVQENGTSNMVPPLAAETEGGRMFHGAQVSKTPAPPGGEPGLRRDRHRQGPALRGGRPGRQRGAGAFVRRVYPCRAPRSSYWAARCATSTKPRCLGQTLPNEEMWLTQAIALGSIAWASGAGPRSSVACLSAQLPHLRPALTSMRTVVVSEESTAIAFCDPK